MIKIPCALTIAGTDPSGGAGIQADLKTFQELKTYGMSVITSVVAQNTTGVQDVQHVPLSIIDSQLESVISDMPIHALKTGMIANVDMMELLAKKIAAIDVPYIMDPVMVAASGDPLIAEKARDFLRDELIPLTTLVTPNIPEAETITGRTIRTPNDMQDTARIIVDKFGAGAALIKGGHLEGEAVDFLYDGNTIRTFTSKRIDTTNTHGTGCTLSAAIAAYASRDYPLQQAVHYAKNYITAAIAHSFDIGSGSGPTNHWAPRMKEVRK